MSDVDAYYYEGSLKEARDRYAAEETARIEGREEGELKAKLEIAQAMIEQQTPLESILQITGLTEEQIKSMVVKSET